MTLCITYQKGAVIATYGHLVIGNALLSYPQETYITYLVVRAGWDNAMCVLFSHPMAAGGFYNEVITPHVSANNPATVRFRSFMFACMFTKRFLFYATERLAVI